MLDARDMPNTRKLEAIKEFRRQRIAALLDQYGKVGLSRIVDISADYLWQMGKGIGKSARGVSDANAAKVETRLGKEPGWMDSDLSAPEGRSQALRLDPNMLAETHKALRELYQESGRVFSIEEEPARFVQVYQMRAGMSEEPSQDEWIKFGRKLVVMPPQGATGDGRGDGVPAKGTDTGKQPGRVRRKA